MNGPASDPNPPGVKSPSMPPTIVDRLRWNPTPELHETIRRLWIDHILSVEPGGREVCRGENLGRFQGPGRLTLTVLSSSSSFSFSSSIRWQGFEDEVEHEDEPVHGPTARAKAKEAYLPLSLPSPPAAGGGRGWPQAGRGGDAGSWSQCASKSWRSRFSMNVRKPESTDEAQFPSIPIGKPIVRSRNITVLLPPAWCYPRRQ